MRTTTFALILATSLAACGGDDGGTVSAIDARRIDGAGGPDAAGGGCDLMGSATINPITGAMPRFRAGTMNPAIHSVTMGFGLGSEMPPDALFIEFYNNYAPFGTAMAPGQFTPMAYTLDSVQADYATCGICLIMSANFDSGTSMGTQDYMPTGGTVTITTLQDQVGGQLDISLANVVMQHVTIDSSSGATTPAADGCTFTIASAQVQGTLVAAKRDGNLESARSKQ